MKRQINYQLLALALERFGRSEVLTRIITATDWAPDTAAKFVRLKYKSIPSKNDRLAIANALKLNVADLFPIVKSDT